ncbi:MAG: GYF domain-containing protein [Rubripirellula sp.]
MTKWFVQRRSNQDDLGPLRPSELLDMVRNGDVTSDSMLRKDDSTWFAASDVGGLFEAAMRPTIRYFCPQCKAEVTEPPVTCPKCDTNVLRALTQIKENSIAAPANDGSSDASGNSVKRWLQKKRLAKDRENESD